MIGDAVAAPVRTTRLSFAAVTDKRAFAGLALLVAVLGLVTWSTWGDVGRDTGYDLVAGSRMAHGQFPYVDYVYYYGPLSPFLLGLVGWLGVPVVSGAFAVGLAVTAAIVATTYALARTQAGPVPAALVAALTAGVAFSPTNLSYVLPHSESAPLALLFSLLFLLGIARYAKYGRGPTLVLAGISAGLVALTRPEFELGVILAASAWLVLRKREGKAIRRESIELVTPAVLVPAAVYLPFLIAVGAHRLFFENLYPLDVLHAGGNHIIRAQAPLTVGSIGDLIGYLLLYAAGWAALLIAARIVSRWDRRVVLAVVALAVTFVAILSIAKSEALRTGLQYVFGWVPLGALLAALTLVASIALRRRRFTARYQVLLLSLIVLTVVSAKNYDGFFFLATRAQPAVYAAPLVAVLLVSVHAGEFVRSRSAQVAGVLWLAFLAAACVGLTVKDAHARSASVSGPGGTLRMLPADAALYGPALRAIERNTRSGEPILIAPQLTMLYVLSGRTDPLPQISLLPGALPNARAAHQAIARLERRKVRFAITDRHMFTEYGQTSFGGSFDRAVAAWVRTHFKHLATIRSAGSPAHTLDIWVGRNS